jgi:hypothetical protein
MYSWICGPREIVPGRRVRRDAGMGGKRRCFGGGSRPRRIKYRSRIMNFVSRVSPSIVI